MKVQWQVTGNTHPDLDLFGLKRTGQGNSILQVLAGAKVTTWSEAPPLYP